MIRNVLTEIGGVGIYGAISIVLFFIVFGGALAWTCLLKKSVAQEMSALPLQDDADQTNVKGVDNDE